MLSRHTTELERGEPAPEADSGRLRGGSLNVGQGSEANGVHAGISPMKLHGVAVATAPKSFLLYAWCASGHERTHGSPPLGDTGLSPGRLEQDL